MNEAALRRTALDWLALRRPAVVVEVLEAQGSTPRERGARMLVGLDAVEGTIGGGHLELKTIVDARVALGKGQADAVERRYALGPSLGQCCGGAVTVRWSPLDAAAIARWPEPTSRFDLQLYGAGHVGRAIVRVLAGIDCRVTWIDEREDQFPPQPSPRHVQRVCVEAVEAEVAEAPAGACFLVMTHSHDLDLEIVASALRRGDFGFLGLIGSATKRARFEHRLRDRGFNDADLQRLVSPIGIAGIEGKEPEVIAVSVVAQLLALAQPSVSHVSRRR